MTTTTGRGKTDAPRTATTQLAGRKPPSMRLLPTTSFMVKNVQRLHTYPDIVRLKLGINDIYLVTNPTMIQEVLVTKQRDFLKGRFLQNTKKVFGEGLLTSEGDFHHRQRRLVQPAFHHDRIRAYAQVMVDYEERTTGRWRDGDTLDVHAEMTKLTMSIIAKCLFNRDVETSAESISHDLTTTIEYFEVLSSPLASILERLPSSRKYHRAAERVDELVYGLIKERRASREDTGDLMSMLLRAREEDGFTAMSDSEVRDEVLITFAAGHETTANALTWAWYLISENPTVEAKLHAEVDAVLGSSSSSRPSPDDVPKLEYTSKVLTESMRVYPPAWILVREAARDVVIGGYFLPKGAGLALSQYVTHHDPRFFPEPERFDPDRWTPEMRSALPKFAYFPFGGGVRSCIGEPFAWMEGVLLLAAISHRWKMRHVKGHRVEMLPRITLRPKYGMVMTLSRR